MTRKPYMSQKMTTKPYMSQKMTRKPYMSQEKSVCAKTLFVEREMHSNINREIHLNLKNPPKRNELPLQ